jgi:PAS domain S-box-containing protein
MKVNPRAKKTATHSRLTEPKEPLQLASFPILNPSPVIQLDSKGHILYINPIAKKLFPDLKVMGFRHPFLRDIKSFFHRLNNNGKHLVTREISTKDRTFHQIITKIPNTSQYIIFSNDITERKKAEELIQVNHAELKQAQHLGHFGSWDWDARIDKITWSEEYYRIVGFDPKKDPPNYKNHLKVYTPESAKRLDEAVKKAMGKGIPYELDLEFTRPDGTRAWITARGGIKRDKKNKIIGLYGTALDITTPKKLAIEREQFYKFFNLSTDIMVIADPNGAFKCVNPTCLSELGYTEKELLAKPFIDFVHPDDKQSTLKEMAHQIKIGSSLNFENRYLCKDGKVVWLSWRANYDKNEKITYATARNITEHKQAEEELHRLNRVMHMLSQTNQKLIHITEEKTLLEEISKVIINLGGYHLLWIGFTGQDPSKTIDPVVQFGMGAKYIKSAKVSWDELEEHGRGPTGTAIRTEKTQLTRDIATEDRMKPWKRLLAKSNCKSSVALPLISNEHTFGILNLYSNKIDAFSDKEIEILEELAGDLAFGIATLRLQKKIADRTEEVNELKNKFIQIVAHQLRTPLNVIRWDLETLLNRERGELLPAQIETMRGAYAANLEIITRLDDLLTAIDIEEGRIRLEMETIDVMELFESVCDEKLQLRKLKKIKCMCTFNKLKTKIPLIQGDPVKMRDIIARLIDNAITYNKDGGKITVKFSTTKGKIRFDITDTGIGIPAFEQAHVFERFYRGWNTTHINPNASGLSLYIAQHYIKAHQGTMGFTSKEKKGSTFWFELPVMGGPKILI